MLIETVQAAFSPYAASAGQLGVSLSSPGFTKTLDILFYLLLGLGILLVAGVILLFVCEYRKYKRFFQQHKFL